MSFTLMQPYFFPYIGHFALIHSVRHFMFFDDVQYKIRSYMVRNRVLNSLRDGSIYIRADIKQPGGVGHNYLHIMLAHHQGWQQRLHSQLQQYRRHAPFYQQTMELVEDILSVPCSRLVDFNKMSTRKTAAWIGLTTTFSDFSAQQFQWTEQPTAGTWGLRVLEALGMDDFINPPGGENFIPADAYRAAGKRLGFIQPVLTPYCQKNAAFIPGLSILDVLMWNGRATTAQLVQAYAIKWKTEADPG